MASVANSGSNTSYYLYSGIWYRSLSPRHMGLDDYASVIHVISEGGINYTEVYNKSGGVQLISDKNVILPIITKNIISYKKGN